MSRQVFSSSESARCSSSCRADPPSRIGSSALAVIGGSDFEHRAFALDLQRHAIACLGQLAIEDAAPTFPIVRRFIAVGAASVSHVGDANLGLVACRSNADDLAAHSIDRGIAGDHEQRACSDRRKSSHTRIMTDSALAMRVPIGRSGALNAEPQWACDRRAVIRRALRTCTRSRHGRT
jgi:hypothetical protein